MSDKIPIEFPIHVFIDTSCFFKDQFGFYKNPLQKIKELVESGLVILHSTEITDLECSKKIKELIGEAAERHEKYIGRAAILRNLEDEAIANTLNPVDKEECKKECISKYTEFLDLCKTVTHEVTRSAILEAFGRYVDEIAPFEAKKKSEFPDAIALSILSHWAVGHRMEIYVASCDNGMRHAAEDMDGLRKCDGMVELLNIVTMTESTKAIIASNLKQIQFALESYLVDLSNVFILSDDWSADVGLIELYDFEIVSGYVVSDDPNKLLLELSVCTDVLLDLDYEDPNSVFRDDDTGQYIHVGRLSEHRLYGLCFEITVAFEGQWQEDIVDDIKIENVNGGQPIEVYLDDGMLLTGSLENYLNSLD